MARPKKPIDEALVKRLAQIMCTMEEIAHICECSVDTLERRFAEVIKQARSTGKMSLRRWQFASAEKGNAGMLIWLGKQYLGQKDIVELAGNQEAPLKLAYSSDEVKKKLPHLKHATIVEKNDE
jgi:hypothetical protein